MVAVPAFGGTVARLVSAGRCHLPNPLLAPSPRRLGGNGRPACAAHAEGAEPDESATASRAQRSDRAKRAGYAGRHSGWRTRPAGAGGTARRTGQSQRRNHRPGAGGRLPPGTSVYAPPVAASLSLLSPVAGGLRSGDRSLLAGVGQQNRCRTEPSGSGTQAPPAAQERVSLRLAQRVVPHSGSRSDRGARTQRPERAYLAGGNRTRCVAFPSAAAFASWLGLCPQADKSGGKVLSAKTRRTKNRLNRSLRLAAQALHRSQSYLGNYYRRMRS